MKKNTILVTALTGLAAFVGFTALATPTTDTSPLIAASASVNAPFSACATRAARSGSAPEPDRVSAHMVKAISTGKYLGIDAFISPFYNH